jgi:hypothetical protein
MYFSIEICFLFLFYINFLIILIKEDYNMSYIYPGYDQDAYPKKEKPVPAIYHKYLSEDALANLYTEEEINNLFNKAYFISNPDAFGSLGFNGAVCEYIDVCSSGQRLLPGSKTSNTVIKEMRVRNLGKDPAWVRLFIAVPAILDDGEPTFDSDDNVLHFKVGKTEGLAEGQWNYGKDMDREAGEFVGDSGWNFYTTEINGIAFNVYVATLETALNPGELSTRAVELVYLDGECTDNEIITINKTFKTDKWQIFAVAEAITVTPEEEEEEEEEQVVVNGNEDPQDESDDPEPEPETAFSAFATVYEEVGDGEGKHNPFA